MPSDDVSGDDWTLDVLRRFTEAHVREYGGYEPLLAIIHAREHLGVEPAVPEYARGVWNELEYSSLPADETVYEELCGYMDGGDD